MAHQDSYDIVILGAGPAGCCAAIRLARLGYRVALVEQKRFPRPQIGESLSPGIVNLLDYLGLAQLLEHPSYLTDIPTRIIWEKENESALSTNSAKSIVVDRSIFDQCLAEAAIAEGVRLFQPTTPVGARDRRGPVHPSATFTTILTPDGPVSLNASLLLDARGRKGISTTEKILTAPPSIALWINLRETTRSRESCVEALPDGWLWGSPLPNNRYRVMALLDSAIVKGGRPAALLSKLVRRSTLLKDAAPYIMAVNACSAETYYHVNPWRDNVIRLGESAFAFDPLSAGGVEKAMRFSLQASIAVNTLLRYNNASLAHTFYQGRLTEVMTTHSAWTREFYRCAWPNTSFWKSRAAYPQHPDPEQRLQPEQYPLRPKDQWHTPEENGFDAAEIIRTICFRPVQLSPCLTYSQTPAVLDDHLELKTAIHHPALQRQLIYLDQEELKPLLDRVEGAGNIADLLSRWNTQMPLTKAGRLIAFLWSKKILV